MVTPRHDLAAVADTMVSPQPHQVAAADTIRCLEMTWCQSSGAGSWILSPLRIGIEKSAGANHPSDPCRSNATHLPGHSLPLIYIIEPQTKALFHHFREQRRHQGKQKHNRI